MNKGLKYLILSNTLLLAVAAVNHLSAQEQEKNNAKWYDRIHLGGYMQIRYNKLYESNHELRCEQCDEFWGAEGGGFSLRRLRFKLYGYVSPRVFFYLQPDFAKSVGENINVARVKDAYIDIGLDEDNAFRLRVGQSKVPFGYENMQSSSQRLPLDRDDALNSGVKDERDMGLYLYWASPDKRKLMHELKKFKHSGDYGVFAFGIYNGQTANHPDVNNQFHVVTRFSYPLKLGTQVLEAGVQAYKGKFVLLEHTEGVVVNDNMEYNDERVAASFVLYPMPFGIQAEYNFGSGPEYDKRTNSIKEKPLQGGYITLSYDMEKWGQHFIPFTRLQYYNGGKKQELDARSYTVRECETGIEWHPLEHFELVMVYALADRRYEDAVHLSNHQVGGVIRMQAQMKF